MKQLPQAIKDSLLNNGQHYLADLWTFEFQDGTRRWTSWDASLTSGTTTWNVGPGFVRGDARSSVGLEVDTLTVTLYPDATQIAGMAMVRAAIAGKFHSVRVTLQRAYMMTPGDASLGVVTEFVGTITDVDPSSTEIKLTIQSLLSQLGTALPRRLVIAQCPYRVYGAECAVLAASFTDARTVAAGSTATVVKLNAASTRAVAGSTIKFTSGALNGITAVVRSVSASDVTLMLPLPSVPVLGDSLQVIRGCDKTRSTCNTVFNNLLRYGGCPDAPKDEAV